MSSVIEQVTNLVSPILAEHHFELVDLEFVKEGKSWYLRVFIDKVGGINIEECALISDLLSEKLDAQDPDLIPQAYYLEVSSPGAERPLKNDRDLQRSLNKYVNVSLYQALNGQKVYEGDLVEITADNLVLAVIQKQRQLKLKIPRQQIAKIRLAIKF
ncbi:MAG: ribosome maturation factor RimP [Liquorilactobacillus nagelii]|uniref:Ribosome maturation factor RimP n=1 Tax=Liquorilactobacillus nagelii TaxID=82688 RepID=A0A3Q8CZG8_9LACO|nr:ribosome maturation factor RimP [Liquorilactobacillus nagelii]AUJ32253.1 ribosome maturation factor RimP [Liquorilactobacillus nagelii]KRL40835.1 ribosome maturation protein RimP [Liquorilactobacillus nagelii DSM 13675]MCC7615428.1 ribosome maturation factor RimP [Liquorilactobacillus nagelii]MCI1632423.1 ribosome maturation factor RimP [Liquorilactobacillus nagelii]MCI1699524.1 ribosome maturation factor RimP [Liquorilactobacillus nagelii]